jgi:hypothetical protein
VDLNNKIEHIEDGMRPASRAGESQRWEVSDSSLLPPWWPRAERWKGFPKWVTVRCLTLTFMEQLQLIRIKVLEHVRGIDRRPAPTRPHASYWAVNIIVVEFVTALLFPLAAAALPTQARGGSKSLAYSQKRVRARRGDHFGLARVTEM